MTTRTKAATDQNLGERLAGALADLAGVREIAKIAVDGEDAIIERLVQLARDHDVAEATIRKALRLKKKSDQLLSILAILYPMIPNPAILRAIAGKKEDADTAKKTLRGRAPARGTPRLAAARR